MNMIFFGLKRAYYGTLVGTRKPLRKLGITAARFDVLMGIKNKNWSFQRDLRRMLAVCAATLTEMLQAIEKLGWIERTENDDRRYKMVRLTDAGLEMIAKVNRFIDEDHLTKNPVTSPF